jgi:peptide/nickel transport system substrate-binding protein
MAIPLIASSTNGAYIIDSEEVKSKGDYDAQTTWFQAGNECGTGPYYVHEWVQTQQLVFKKFNDYWRGWEGKHYDTCIMKYVTEGSTLIQMLEGGDAQIIHDPPIDLISRLEANSDIKVVGEPSYWNMVCQLNCQKSPTDDLQVRKALSYAWDYDGICTDIWKGYATPAKGPVPAGIWGRPDDLPTYTFNVEKAKQTLTAAGWVDTNNDGIREKDGTDLAIEITCFENEVYRKAAEYWQTVLTEVGFDATLNITPFDTGWSRAKNFDTSPHVFMLDWWPTYITPFDYLYSMFYSEEIGGFNCGYYDNPIFDDEVMTANSLEGTDMTKATEHYANAQKILIDDAAAVYAWDRQDIFAHNKNIVGLNPNPAYPMVMFLYNISWKD